jgi:HAE1 family hydrophobic/amphiphilic exporter-1
MLPMALASGIGSELRAGIGIASTGGVVVAGILTMTVLPLTFLFFTAKSPEDRRK